MSDAFRVAHLDDLERLEAAGGIYWPIRRRLGVRAFGINAYTAAKAGNQVVEHHHEGAGSGRHEELYLVVAGHAEFTVADETIDAPAGTMVFVSDVDVKRGAVATADETTVIVVGGPADRPLPTSPFEYWFAAEPAYKAGDYDRAVEVASEGRVARTWSAELPAGLLPRTGRAARAGARAPGDRRCKRRAGERVGRRRRGSRLDPGRPCVPGRSGRGLRPPVVRRPGPDRGRRTPWGGRFADARVRGRRAR